LCPAIVERSGACETAIATPGDHGQPQSIHQVLTRRYAEGLHIQAAIESPRLRHDEGRSVMIESRAPKGWFEAIKQSGYDPVDIGPWSRMAGGVNAIERTADGLLLGGADPRRSSYAVSAE
jgi:gamma-glutamyltranspeptidase/glutathione hydrolase